jgi:hypothetical protein
MNARGRNEPWSFAATEEQFCLLARMQPCLDKDFCKGTTVEFTKEPDPTKYGKLNRHRDNNENYCATDNYFEMCARSAMLVLRMQDFTLGFLVKCAADILRDIPEELLFESPVQEEPPVAEIIADDKSGHATFSNLLMFAPYRGWQSLNFEKLHGYISATCGMHQEHVWALHEDPAYFADTLQEYEDHIPYEWENGVHHLSQRSGEKIYRNVIVAQIIDESFCMLAGWQELDRRFANFDRLFQQGVNLHDQYHAVSEVEHVADWMKKCLTRKIGESYLAAPNIRKMMKEDFDEDGKSFSTIKPGRCTDAQRRVIDMFQQYKLSTFSTPSVLSWSLETLDRLVQGNPECKAMMSERLLSLLTDVSVLAECLRQIALWKASPKVMAIEHSDCHYVYKIDNLNDFLGWFGKKDGDHSSYSLPNHHIYPYEEKLFYPAHKRRTRDNVDAMRQAEANLDRFWAIIGETYEKETGIYRHSLVQAILDEGGELKRTAPWPEQAAVKTEPKEKPEYEYQPLSRMIHNKEMQITGAFDKLAVEEKIKTKTRGSPTYHAETDNDQAAQAVSIPPCETSIIVDQRTHKVFKTIFYTPTTDTGDLPKAVKWAEFKRAMTRVGFAVEKLQGSAWQFTPSVDSNAERNISFHEPHPDSDVPYVMAKRFGRRLGRVYGWSTDTFKLA